MGAFEMAVQVCYNRWLVVCHWDDPFFRQSIHSQFEWFEVVRGDHASGRNSVFVRLGLLGLDGVESGFGKSGAMIKIRILSLRLF